VSAVGIVLALAFLPWRATSGKAVTTTGTAREGEESSHEHAA
jgi:hypothetical protein